MRRKVLFGIDYTDSAFIKLVLYLFFFFLSALVEWALFYFVCTYVLNAFGLGLTSLTMLATSLAFCLSTLYHYFLGNVLVFDSGSRYDLGRELSVGVLVSIMGLGFNLLLMYIFVTLLGWQPMLSKVLTSCIVVVWNYLSRKKWIFRS